LRDGVPQAPVLPEAQRPTRDRVFCAVEIGRDRPNMTNKHRKHDTNNHSGGDYRVSPTQEG
jgi:hypothetical protein